MTPEAKIKRKIRTVLDEYGDRLYKYMPVPGGFGTQSVDYLICFGGMFIAIEAKRPGGKLTPRQDATLAQIEAAGGATFVVRDDQGVRELELFLESVGKWG